MNSTSSKNSRIERAVHGSSRHRSLVLLLSVVVVLITAYFLILPALTLENESIVSSDLSDFLSNAVITGATQNGEGQYEVEAGREYNIILSFSESSAHQFDNHATLTYQMPAGLTILSRQTGELNINIVYKGRTYQVGATYDLGTDGKLEIKFDENDPDFHHLENTTNVSFRFSYDGSFDRSKNKIHFSEDIELDIVYDYPVLV